MATLKTTLQIKRDTAANWETIASTYIPPVGEPCYETDTQKLKIGDGTKTYSELSYIGGTVSNYFEGTISLTADGGPDKTFEEAVVAALGEGVEAADGDTLVIKTEIASGKYSYTAYVFDAGNWKAMDGNYDASNVYFSENFTITQNVGNYTTSNNTPVEVPVTGKNIIQAFETLWATEDTDLTVDQPSISLTLSGNASGEVGDTYTRPTATLSISNTGSYEYGSKNEAGTAYSKDDGTGVTFSGLKVALVSSSTGTIANATKYTEVTEVAYTSGQSITYTADTEDIASNTYTDAQQKYYFRGNGTHTSSDRKPITNLDNFVNASNESTTVYAEGTKAISGTTLDTGVKTWTASGWRNFWYGYVKLNLTENYSNSITRSATTNALTWDDVTLTAGGKAITTGYLPGCTASAGLKSAAGDVAFVVLVPNSANKQFDSITALGTINTLVPSDAYEKISNAVSINGYNGSAAVSYDILIYRPDEIPAGTTLTVKLK